MKKVEELMERLMYEGYEFETNIKVGYKFYCHDEGGFIYSFVEESTEEYLGYTEMDNLRAVVEGIQERGHLMLNDLEFEVTEGRITMLHLDLEPKDPYYNLPRYL